MDDFFYKIYRVFQKQKVLFFGFFLLLLFLLGFLASKLQFEEDITKLIPTSEESDITNKVLKNVNFADKIIVYLETQNDADANDLSTYASEFIDSIQQQTGDYIKEIQGKIADDEINKTLDFIYNNLPLFLNESDYRQIEKRLQPDSIQQITNSNYKTLVSPTGLIAKRSILKDPLGLTFMGLKKLEQLKTDDNFEIHNGFLVSKDHKNLLLFIVPKFASNETAKNTQFVEQLYRIQEHLNQKYNSKVSSEYYGSTIIAVANANQIKNDIQFTISIALTILVLILIFFYRKLLIPIILFLPTIFGALVAVSFLYLLKGQISAISLGIGSVLLGITLDYALHILTHYKNNNNVKQLYKDVAKPVLMSSFTTAIAFLCLLFLDSEALKELGIFASVSVVSASFFALLLIPQLYRYKNEKISSKNTVIDKIAGYRFYKNKILIGSLIIVFITSLFTYRNVIFDQDISKMNYQSEALKITEKKLDNLMNMASKSIYVTAYGDSVEDALLSNDSIYNQLNYLKSSNSILSFSSVGGLVLSEQSQEKKIQQWKQFWNVERKQSLRENLIESGTEVGFKPTTFQQFYDKLDSDFSTVKFQDYQKLKSLFLDEFISVDSNFATAVSMVKVDQKNLKSIINKLDDLHQTVVIDRQHINETFLGSLKDDFNKLIGYSLVAVVIILLLFYRSIEITLITIIPIALTWIITIGVMGLLNIHFNVFNIIISTFIFGLGVDYSIFITNGLLKKHKYGIRELPTYKTSILLSVITTILGVGVLIFAKHPALKSISAVSIIGILSAVLIAFTIQPLLFNFFIGWRTKKGVAPLRIRTFLHAMVLFAFYGLGGMILSLISITILPILPISKKKKMKWLHNTMAKMVTATLYGNPFVKKEVINSHGETFEKPAIIISNHSSFLDTLTIGMTTPNVIYLVNDWVYKSPIFGLLAKVAGFYPVSSGVDGSLEHLEEKIRQGYCLVVFPEARRSFTNKIGRFHKGAFFLAQQLKLDILPLYLHGNAEVLPKRDFIIYDGSLTVVVGKRIAYDDASFGTSDRERTKKIGAFYKQEFQKVRDTIEDENYFKDILLSNYHYKGLDIFNTVKNDFSANKLIYKELSDMLPSKANIIHFADDFGQIDILLVSRFLDRKIATLIENKEKRSIAKNCYTNIHRNVQYLDDFEQFSPKKDVFLLISDDFNNISLVDKVVDLQINNVFLVKNDQLLAKFIANGYQIKHQTESIIHLIR
ncbi:MMPL family transporter [Aureibaculum sp. 2210JD6-5]|uniref:MMPL family transporter n=1 Tax=Aureibaculum sp. 2210JD6-5 TaxID=3103957 RepID=UPI002AAEA73F|nr:MMPL family transporter [Aureibaculum sp. 2210JD6-5]MDY7393860.1 MMPL family transporter [Aureibaculum sp. 2210JD6-5]